MIPTRTLAGVTVALLLFPAWSGAQPLGQFQWQLEPFCNVVTLNVTQSGSIYTLDGFDNQCGGSNPRAPLVGVAAPNPNGSIGFGFTIVTTPNGSPVHVRATIGFPALSGDWTDSAGNSGAFRPGTTASIVNPRPPGVVFPTLSVVGSASFGGALTAGSVVSTGAATFAGAVAGDALSVATNGTFGGTVTANTVIATGNVGVLRADGASNTSQPQLVLSRARGTPAAPTAVTSGTSLGVIFFAGLDGSTSRNSSLIGAFASEAFTPTAHGSHLVFSTTASGTVGISERMRIRENGRVGIGTNNPDQVLAVNGDASKVGGGSWQVFSDERLKTVHGTFTRGLADLLPLQPIRYEYRADNPLGLKGAGAYVGFSAQAVRDAIPEAVSQSTSGYLQVNADPILWTMLNAIKELKAVNDGLAARNLEMERRLAALEALAKKP